MSQTAFSIVYSGPALDGGGMDVRDLAPALLSAGQLFDAANSVLNGEQVKVNVNVKATGEGSFEIFLELVQTYGQQIVGLFSGDDITAANNLRDLILFGGAGVVGLFELLKKLRGRRPNRLEKIDNGLVRVTIDNESFEVPIKLLQLYQDLTVRTALQNLVQEPLKREGLNTFAARDGDTNNSARETVKVSKTESRYFARPEVPEETLIEDMRRSAFSIVSLAFKEENKWRLHDGNAPISARITDEDFLYRVDNNQIAFAKWDVLICDVKMTQTHGQNGLKTEYVVEKVVEHKPAAQQMALILEPPAE